MALAHSTGLLYRWMTGDFREIQKLMLYLSLETSNAGQIVVVQLLVHGFC